MKKANQILILLTIVLLSLAGCQSKDESPPAVRSSSSTASLSENYDTLNALKQGATNILEVEVLDNYVVVYGDMPFTISTVNVLTSIKGGINKDDKIKVIETGGKYTTTGEDPKEKKGQEVDMAFGGIGVMRTGEHLILFIKPFIGPQVADAYVPLGVWQGKFKVGKGSNGRVEQQAPDEYKLKDYAPVSLSAFIKQLEN